MKKQFEGRVRRLGHNVAVNQIYPVKYRHLIEPAEMKLHLFEDLKPEISGKIDDGDIIVAGRIFGSGPGRESAAVALKHSGVACIIAESFGRFFYREAINQGLPVVEQKEARDKVKEGEVIVVDLEKGEVRCRKGNLNFRKYSEIVERILEAGGLMPYTERCIGKK